MKGIFTNIATDSGVHQVPTLLPQSESLHARPDAARRHQGVFRSCFRGLLLVTLLCVPVIAVLGADRALHFLGHSFIAVAWGLCFINVAIVLPLLKVESYRQLAADSLILSSCVFAMLTWLLGLIVAYALWGFWMTAAAVGLLWGVGAIPLALLGTMLDGQWELCVSLIMMIVSVIGLRVAGKRAINKEQGAHNNA